MTPQMTLTPRTWAALGLMALIWGASFLSVRVALNEIGPLAAVLHRTGWAMGILWAYVGWRRVPFPRDLRTWGAFLVMGLLNNVVPFCLMAWGQLHIESGLTSILNAATAIFGVLVAALVFSDERLTLRKAVGVGIGFLGVATAIGLGQLRALDLRSLAQLAVIAGTISYAFAGAWGRFTLKGLRPEVAAAGMLTGSTLIMIPITLMFEGVPSIPQLGATYWAIGYFSVIATALAYLLYYRILAAAGSGNTMLVTLLVAPIAIVLGALVLHEDLPPHAYSGFALLGLGLVVLDGRVWRALFDRAARAG